MDPKIVVTAHSVRTNEARKQHKHATYDEYTGAVSNHMHGRRPDRLRVSEGTPRVQTPKGAWGHC